jgi:pimeloyl-ACP methyl ester carboxylesterase
MKLLLITISLCLVSTMFGQQKTDTVDTYWYYFGQSVDIKKYEGKKFILESAMRSEGKDSGAGCSMWASVDKKNGMGFFDNMWDRQVKNKEWKKYTISGVIDSSAQQFSFGGLAFYNGAFYYDSFTLKVETLPGKWINININNGNFELPIKKDNWAPETGLKRTITRGFSLAPTLKNPYQGKYSLKVLGSGVNNYGVNDAAGKFYKINGVSIYCEVYGSGTPLLLLHGNGQSISAMMNQIAFFKDKYKVIIPDCRGRGRSSDNEDALTYHNQAKDMHLLLDSLKIDSAHIIGWSDGGIIGIIMAMEYPARVKKLITSGANILQDTTVFTKEDIAGMTAKSNDTSNSRMSRKLNNLMVSYPNIPYKELSKIQCPVLFVSGDREEISLEHTIKMYESVKKGQLFVVPATSHYVLSENVKVFNEAALKFLKN